MSAADVEARLADEIHISADGITIGGQLLPGAIVPDILVMRPSSPDQPWKVAVTFASNEEPFSASDVVNDLINNDFYLVRPATADDL